MLHSTLFAIAAVVALAVVSPSVAQGSFNPCHANRNPNVFGAFACERVLLPGSLTRNCRLKPPAADGTFIDCTSIYDLDDDRCKRALRRYVAQNPCDEKRAANFQDYFRNGDLLAREQLDYFLYSLAEQCCDCIPQRPADGSLLAVGALSVFRGNCPAHAAFDICSVFPSVKLITSIGRASRTPDVEDLPPICPPLRDWLGSDAARAWKRQNETVISEPIVDFLEEAVIGLKCRAPATWSSCFGLEAAQGRV